MSRYLPHIYASRDDHPRKSRHRKRKVSWLAWPFILLRNFIFIFIIISVLLTLVFRWANPPFTTFMLVKTLPTEQLPKSIHWAEVNNISPHLLIAVVAAEDQKFPTHFGFDFKAIQSALEKNKNNKTLRGASTITQQVAKNVFLWPQKSLLRKGLEAYFAILIEAMWPKWRILEVYLNIAEFGPNLFGAHNAAYAHFGKSAINLTQQEAALLAAVLPNPHKLHASKPSEYVANRATEISEQIYLLGGIHYLDKIWD